MVVGFEQPTLSYPFSLRGFVWVSRPGKGCYVGIAAELMEGRGFPRRL